VKSQRVHLRISDAATGQPTPVRLRVTDAEGCYCAPYGRLAEFSTQPGVDVGLNILERGEAWAIIDGGCEIDLPVGPVRIRATKGFEYVPLDTTVTLAFGKMSMRFAIERLADLRTAGWHSGDTCAYFLSPHAALLEAEAEDLAVVDLLVREQEIDGRPGLSNMAAFSGQAPALARPGHMVVVGTRNQGPTGALLLLNSHRVVYPLSFRVGEPWSYADWRDQCRRKGGIVIGDDWLRGADYGLDGNVDAIRYLPDRPLQPWLDAISRDCRLPLVAGSGKTSNAERLGSWRTYAKVDGPLDYRAWTGAIREGRTFVTRGPLLTLRVGDRDPGATIRESVDAEVVVNAPGFDGRLEVVSGDHVLSSGGGPRLEATLPLTRGWMLARAIDLDGIAALTSPIYVV
jgi:hypothetical protein